MQCIYFLKQSDNNRVKVGKSIAVHKRIQQLEKTWGKFDSNSEILYFSKHLLEQNSLNLDNIESTMQRLLKMKSLYLPMEESKGKDGRTEFFLLDNNELKSLKDTFKHLISKVESLDDSVVKDNKMKYLDELVLLKNTYKSKKEISEYIHYDNYLEKEESINFLSKENSKLLHKLSTIDFPKTFNYSYSKDYLDKEVKFEIFVDKDDVNDLTDELMGNTMTIGKRHYKNLIPYISYNKEKITFSISFDGGKNTSLIIKKLIYALISSMKVNGKRIPLKSKIKRNRLTNFDGKSGVFKLLYLQNNRTKTDSISLHDIFKITCYSEKFKIIFLDGSETWYAHENNYGLEYKKNTKVTKEGSSFLELCRKWNLGIDII